MSNSRSTAPRILLHLPNWLGDVIMTTPLIEFLLGAFSAQPVGSRPELALAVRPAWSPLFAGDARLAGLVPVDRRGRHGGPAGIPRLAADFRRGRYDAVVLGPPSLRAGLTARLAGIPLRIGHATDGRGPLLNAAVPRGVRGSRHYAWEMLELGLVLLDRLGLAAPLLPTGGLPSPALPGCASLSRQPFGGGGRPLWAVAPGTTYGEAKTWPLERMREFVAAAVAVDGARVVLLGDAQAAVFAAGLRQDSILSWGEDPGRDTDIIDLTGRTDLPAVVRVLKAAAGFVGNDSGLMHLAGALGVPTVGIFGSSNPDWTHPLGARTAAVTAAGFPCRPCYRRTCNQAQFCLETVAAAAVAAQLRSLLADAVGRGQGD